MSKVSIIMPVYNAEKYLGQAIESVLSQTYTDFELLLIDDKSTDNSKEICREYSKKDSRITLLANNSECHGPGPTRNIGLDYATGDYVYFMDADDWIDQELLECTVNRMKETNAELVEFGLINEWNDGNEGHQYCWKGRDLLTKDEIKRDFLQFWKESGKNLVMHLFRYNIVETIRFENIINSEDICFMMDVLCKVEKIAYISEPFYHYRYVEGSTCHHWVENTVECLELLWNHQKRFLESFQVQMDSLAYAVVAYDDYSWALYQLGSRFCPLTYREKRRELLRLEKKMEFDSYRRIYPLEMQHGLLKIKFMLIKYRLEGIILLFGALYYRLVNGK
ncbi:MAG: glycosyltransferase family 2 protein [Eubacteriales bacterium]|nr:glycosyltransferase family 2 protein [Eubacteriales bacterium]